MSATGELGPAATAVVYAIRHVIRGEALDEALADRHAGSLLIEPLVGLTLDEQYAGLVEALASTARLAEWFGDPAFERRIDENEFRGHLLRVRDHLDQLRPWFIPLVRALDPARWADYGDSRLVGRLHLRVPRVEKELSTRLFPFDQGGTTVYVAVLALKSGAEIAVVGHWWPDDLRSTAVFSRDPDASAADLMWHLADGYRFAPIEYEVLG